VKIRTAAKPGDDNPTKVKKVGKLILNLKKTPDKSHPGPPQTHSADPQRRTEEAIVSARARRVDHFKNLTLEPWAI